MLPRFAARLKNIFRRRQLDAELDDELRFHVEMETEANARRGLAGSEARRAALRDLGGVTGTREAVHDVRTGRWRSFMTGCWHDARYGVRMLRRSPGFAAVAIFVLSLGIGVNTALFSVVNALFFRTLPMERPEELVYLAGTMSNGDMWAVMSPTDQTAFRSSGASLMDFTSHWAISQGLTIGDETEVAHGEWVEHNYFNLLGVKPWLGRGLESADDDPATAQYSIVISYDLWTRRFHSDPGAVGQHVRVTDRDATVVGVMGRGFSGLSDPWTPTQIWSGLQAYEYWGVRRLYADGPIGRMKPGATFDQVRAFVSAEARVVRQTHMDNLIAEHADPRFFEYARRMRFQAYRAVDVDLPRTPEAKLVPTNVLVAVTTVLALILVIATANIAGMLLSRGIARTGEMAVRRALGAGALRLTRLLFTESLLVAAAGGALGLGLSVNLVTLFQKYSPSRYYVDVHVDWRVLMFAAAVCLGTGLLVGIAPSLQAANVNVLEALSQGIVGARRVRVRLRQWIVVPQIALSLALLLVAGVHVRALMAVELTDLGYQPDNAAVLVVDRWEPRVTTEARRRLTADARREADEGEAAKYRTFNRAVIEQLEALGQKVSFGLTDSLPLRSGQDEPRIVMPDSEGAGGAASAAAQQSVASDGYFAAVGMTMKQGRSFDGRDGLYGVKAAVLSESLARKFWPAGDALGHSIAFVPQGTAKAEWLTVIGVVNDVEPVLHDTHAQPRVYVSLLQQWRGDAPYLVVRTAGVPRDEFLQAVRRAVVGADAFSEVRQIQTMKQMVGEILYPRRVAAAILLAAGLVGLLLASIGLYGVVSYSVAQRLREIGIRASLGAGRSDILTLILREGATVLLLGTVPGLGLGLMALRLTANLVGPVPTMDAAAVAGVTLIVAAVIVIACYLPARRAACVDPMDVLRTF